MISRYMVDVTSQRMQETEQAILEQRTYAAGLTDPTLKVIAARTLATLEDIVLIMKRTHGLLVETASNGSQDPDAHNKSDAHHASGSPRESDGPPETDGHGKRGGQRLGSAEIR